MSIAGVISWIAQPSLKVMACCIVILKTQFFTLYPSELCTLVIILLFLVKESSLVEV